MQSGDVQLRTSHLFYAMTLHATAISLFGLWGLAVAAFVLLLWWQILAAARQEVQQHSAAPLGSETTARGIDARHGGARMEVVVATGACLLVLGLLMPSRETADPMQQGRIAMQMVAKALAEYQAQHGHLPPPPDGDSGISWRVAILKELGENALANAYHPYEAWTADANYKLGQYRPWFFRPFYGENAADASTVTPLHLVRMEDGFWVVELAERSVPWLTPGELTPEQWEEYNTLPPEGTGFWYRGFFASSFRGRLAVNDRAAMTLLPGEKLPAPDVVSPAREVVQQDQGIVLIHVGNIGRLVIFLLTALYPLRWLHRLSSSA
ncbi:MAG: hypothetical protein KatS3mg111_3332 [Pirellulaceae bacterium]|nr:MAG: hypothetical protein KatS3mg111_3332 [Pirellulaceae bacterium]